MKTIIFGSAEIKDYDYIKGYICEGDKIICCDGGTKHTYKLGITPDIILGDLDSADMNIIEYYRESKIEFVTYPSKKNHTDLEIGLDYAIENNAKNIIIFGGIGSRFDHSIANVFLLQKGLDKGIDIKIINENNTIMLIDKRASISGDIGEFVSLIPITQEAVGVSTDGLEYPLDNATLYNNTSLGVSNRLDKDKAIVTIEKGLLLVIQARD